MRDRKAEAKIDIDSDSLDIAIEKANQLIKLLQEAQQIANSLDDSVLPKLQAEFEAIDTSEKAMEEEKMAQSREEMRKRIMAASKRKILRRQMELLAEYSRTNYEDDCPIPEASQAMVSVHKELVKAERVLIVRILIAIFGFFYLVKSFSVKGIQFIKR